MMNRITFLLSLFVLTFASVATDAQEQARFAPDAEIRDAFNDVVREARASVVQLVVDGEERVLGTLIDDEGYILSKASELSGEKIKAVLSTGRGFDAKLVGIDRKNDLAMLKIEGERLPAVSLAFDKPGLGRMVACVS